VDIFVEKRAVFNRGVDKESFIHDSTEVFTTKSLISTQKMGRSG